MKKQKMHYAWKIVIACVLMKLGTGGALGVAVSNFVSPIVEELGCEVSQLTMFTSICGITMALLYTTAARFLNRKHIGLILGIASMAEITGLALMSTYKTVEMFYLSGVIVGAAQAFTGFVAIPIVLNMWFKKNNGTVLGFVTAVGTVATMLYTVLSAQLITSFGWRAAYLIMAVMASVITLPAVFFLIKTPEEAGCQPYGAEEAQQDIEELPEKKEEGLTKRQAFRMPLLYVAWLACVLYSYGCGVAYYATPFVTMELGQSISFGAAVTVALSLGSTLSSLIVGKINDKYGVKAGMLWGALTTALGFGMMFLSYRNPNFAYAAVFVVGLGNSMYMVQCPLLAQNLVGTGHYSEIWPIMMMVNSLVGGGLNFSIGLFYDRLGTYRGAFVMATVLYILAGLLGALAINVNNKRKQKEPLAPKEETACR